jgi:cyanate permease
VGLQPATTELEVDGAGSNLVADWPGLAAVWMIYFSFGLVAGSFAPVITEIRDELLIGAGRVGLLLGIWQLVYFLASVPVSKFIGRHSLTLSLSLAAALIACSALLRAAAPSYLAMLIAVVFLGLGGPFISIGAPTFVATSFGARHRSLAVSIYVTGPPIGTTVAAAGTHSLFIPALGSWRAVFAAYGVVTLAAGVMWAAVRRARTGRVFPAQARAPAQPGTTRRLLAVPAMWALLAFGFITFAVNHALGSWTVELLRTNDFDEAYAGTVASIPVLVGIVAALVIPRVAAGRRRTATIVTVQVIGALAMLALLDPSQWDASLALPLAAIGVLRASALPLATLMIMDDARLGGTYAVASVGIYFAVGEFGGLVGPLATGLLVDRTGSFDSAVWVLVVLALAGAATGAAASRSVHRGRTEPVSATSHAVLDDARRSTP